MLLTFMLPGLIVILNWLLPLALPFGVKVAIGLGVMIVSYYYFWSRLSSGSVFAPEFPRLIVVLFNWLLAAVLFLALFQLVLDVGVLCVDLVRWRLVSLPDPVREGAALFALLLSAVGVMNAVKVPAVKDVRVTIAGLPPQFEGYRLLQLTDLHISRLFPASWAKAVVARANTAGADLIVVTGDFIDGSVAMRQADIAPLEALHAPDGVLAVAGNHEYFFDYNDWMQRLSQLGITMLLNTHTVLTRGEGKLVVAGVTDLSASAHGQAGPDITAALQNSPVGAPVILLDHQPRMAATAADHGVALQLSGHTHGGMIVGLDRLVARGNNGFVSGRYRVGGMTLYVSNGTGLWPGFALRLGCPPEMTRFTLTAET
ncbi:metallophosphoesterase [Acetobacter indonesiensis]|uniref:metallophosphoesterase n=1 Tax=Acetobacter indonesiensis TaxID=104101 RepID=UPI0038D19FD8